MGEEVMWGWLKQNKGQLHPTNASILTFLVDTVIAAGTIRC